MAKVALVVDAIPSHIYSSIGLARRLERRGFAIEYWGIAKRGSDALIESQGYPFYALSGMWSRYEDDTRLPTDLSFANAWLRGRSLFAIAVARRDRTAKLRSVLDLVERSLDTRLRESKPTFVIVDPFLLAYYPLLKRRGVPTVVLSTKALPIRDAVVPPYDSWLVPTASVANRARIASAWTLRQLLDLRYRLICGAASAMGLHTYEALLAETARRTGFPLRRERVRRWIQPDIHFKSVQEWALWTAETDLPRQQRLPSNVRYIGPSVDLERRQRDLPFTFEPRAKIVYVAVGTVRFRWKDNLPFLRKVIAAFAETADVLVVMSTGGEQATKALGAPPKNILLFDFLPQLGVLEVAHLAITHAGAGTYRECIEKTVPMLAYPRNHDQIGNAARVEYHGIGLRGRRDVDTPAAIRSKAFRILGDPRFVERLAALRTAVKHGEERLLTEALDALDVPARPISRWRAASQGRAAAVS